MAHQGGGIINSSDHIMQDFPPYGCHGANWGCNGGRWERFWCIKQRIDPRLIDAMLIDASLIDARLIDAERMDAKRVDARLIDAMLIDSRLIDVMLMVASLIESEAMRRMAPSIKYIGGSTLKK